MPSVLVGVVNVPSIAAGFLSVISQEEPLGSLSWSNSSHNYVPELYHKLLMHNKIIIEPEHEG